MRQSYSEWIVLLILLVNTLLAVLYMVVMGIRTRETYVYYRGVVMLLCPVTGVVCFFVTYLLNLNRKERETDYENLSMDKTRQKFLEGVDREREMQVIPVEEALAVSVTEDKRRVMLNMLKTDISGNLGLVRKAVENDDAETSHYAAAALTNALARFNREINEWQVRYDRDRSDLESNLELLDVVYQMLGSGGLQGVQETEYHYKYIHLLENLDKYHPEAITAAHYAMMVKAYMGVGDPQQAERWAERSLLEKPDSEQSYLNVMYVKFALGRQEEFQETLDRLTHSDIALSQKGLDIVRFWLAR